MDKSFVLTPVPIDELIAAITVSVLEAMRKDQEQATNERLLSTAEVCEMFRITPVTLSAWIRKGDIIKHSIGGKNFFKYSEIMESMKTLKKYKQS